MQTPEPTIPNFRDRVRISLLAHTTETTVRRAYRGVAHARSILAVGHAARQLGIEPPLMAEPLAREARRG